MRILVLLTTSFPYGSKEPFIENELPIMSKYFDRVITYALYANEEIRKIEIPENFSCFNISSTKKERIRSLWRVFCCRDFWKEFFIVLRRNNQILPRVRHLLKFSTYAFTPLPKIVNSLKRESLDSPDTKLTFYGYWFVEHAFLAQKLKEKFKGYLSLSRAHGYDLYESRECNGYIPYRNFLCNQLDYIFPISTNGQQILNGYLGKSTVLLSRLGTPDYGFSPLSEKTDQITIVSCSWCVPVKRIHLIIEALTYIKNLSVIWIHLGDGQSLMELKSLATENLKDNVSYEFKGRLSNMDIISFYKTTPVDLFINVSSSEGIPVSIMEASSFGIPTIATNVGGVSEIITDSYNGWLLDVASEPRFIAKVIESYGCMSEAKKKELRQNARTLWRNRYNAEKNYNEFYAMITK